MDKRKVPKSSKTPAVLINCIQCTKPIEFSLKDFIVIKKINGKHEEEGTTTDIALLCISCIQELFK